MSDSKKQVKITWFSLRTGCSHEEAKKWLAEAKWKLEIAIRDRRSHQQSKNK
jgi:hypothetical protein